MATEPTKRLGRGLDALLGDYAPKPQPAERNGDDAQSGERGDRRTVPLAFIHPNPRNPRTTFAQEDLDDLAVSIQSHGMVQPIVVRPVPNRPDYYEIIAGERRWRAAQKAGLHDVTVTLLDVSDQEALELAIVENVQRADLNPVEEALGYNALIEEFHYSQADLGAKIGKSRVHVTNTLRLLKLPDEVIEYVRTGDLSAGHARALINAPDAGALAMRIVENGLSVRDTEKLVRSPQRSQPAKTPPVKDADTRALEQELEARLGLKLDIRHKSDGKGEIRIAYTSLEQLDALCRKLRG
jgi:ParB family chromosome partitioning protein